MPKMKKNSKPSAKTVAKWKTNTRKIAVGGATAGAKSLMRKELMRHASKLKRVGAQRSSQIGSKAANKFGRAADAAIRKARKLSPKRTPRRRRR